VHDYSVRFVDDFAAELAEDTRPTDFFIVDAEVAGLYGEGLGPVLEANQHLLIEATEPNKSLAHVSEVIDVLIAAGVRRNHRLVAVGGGIMQDITGFIGSVLYRGVPWVFYPTTLLAQNDSCIGSKTSINVGDGKNQLGTFYPPTEIVLDTAFLKTLTPEDIKSGLGEVIKVHLLDSRERAEFALERVGKAEQDDDAMFELIVSSLAIKKRVIEIDEFDRDYRNIMNYGHTFGHAIESLTDYGVPHGQAVVMGMDIADFVSRRLGMLSDADYEFMRSLIVLDWPDYDLSGLDLEAYGKALSKDKKNVDAQVTAILTEGPGEMFKHGMPLPELMEHVEAYFAQ
jgi:3-dehydroquinate synthase